MIRVAAYCRVSTDQDDQRNSLQNQRRYFDAQIRQNPDWKLVDVYADEGLSGTTAAGRPEFQRMLADAYAGKVDLILTKEVSRFARNTVDALKHTRELGKRGVGILFLNDHIDTRQDDGEFRLTIMASVAQEESRKTSERVKWGQRRSMEHGVVFGSNSLYGYDLTQGKLTILPEEAAVIRRIYHKFLDEGKGTYVIARELYEEGIAPPKAKEKPWSPVMILRILRNEKYCGDLLQQKYYTPNYLDHKKVLNPHEKVYLRDHHTAIIGREEFERVQQELARRAPSETQKMRYSARYWCSGKIVCGGCGARFVPRKRRRTTGQIYFSWTCRAKGQFGNRKVNQKGNAVGCNMRSINQKTVHTCMTHVLGLLQVNPAKIAERLGNLLVQTASESETQQLYRQLECQRAGLLRKKDRALDAYFEQTISKEDLERMRRRYEEEENRIHARIAALERQKVLEQHEKADIEELQRFAKKNWIGSETVWGEVLEQMTVYPDYVDIKLHALTEGFRLRYTTSGRGETYQTVVTACTVLPTE